MPQSAYEVVLDNDRARAAKMCTSKHDVVMYVGGAFCNVRTWKLTSGLNSTRQVGTTDHSKDFEAFFSTET